VSDKACVSGESILAGCAYVVRKNGLNIHSDSGRQAICGGPTQPALDWEDIIAALNTSGSHRSVADLSITASELRL